MLREMSLHADWADMTMSTMREKQFEACERRLFAYPAVSLFSNEATEADAQALLSGSFDDGHGISRFFLVSLESLRARVLERLPMEALYISAGEMQLLEKLLMNDGQWLLGDWDDLGAAEALVRRLWCSFRAEGDDWYLLLPDVLHGPLSLALGQADAPAARERLFRFDATIHGLLYIAGLLHSSQPMGVLMHDVFKREDDVGMQIARRYLQSSFEYVTDANGDLILLHPGLADPYRLVNSQRADGIFTLQLSQEMIAGGMNGILPEEIPLHERMCGALNGALRPEYELGEAAEDLRMLVKQGVSLPELEYVMASMLSVLPTQRMKDALKEMYLCTPHWMGLKTAATH